MLSPWVSPVSSAGRSEQACQPFRRGPNERERCVLSRPRPHRSPGQSPWQRSPCAKKRFAARSSQRSGARSEGFVAVAGHSACRLAVPLHSPRPVAHSVASQAALRSRPMSGRFRRRPNQAGNGGSSLDGRCPQVEPSSPAMAASPSSGRLQRPAGAVRPSRSAHGAFAMGGERPRLQLRQVLRRCALIRGLHVPDSPRWGRSPHSWDPGTGLLLRGACAVAIGSGSGSAAARAPSQQVQRQLQSAAGARRSALARNPSARCSRAGSRLDQGPELQLAEALRDRRGGRSGRFRPSSRPPSSTGRIRRRFGRPLRRHEGPTSRRSRQAVAEPPLHLVEPLVDAVQRLELLEQLDGGLSPPPPARQGTLSEVSPLRAL